MTLALASRFTSMVISILPRAEVSVMSDMPSIFFSMTKSAILFTRSFLITPYGISDITIWSWSLCDSISALARISMRPRPVSKASLTPWRPNISPPVGKSGALTYSIRSDTDRSLLSISAIAPLSVSVRLCGGILVAIPTAIPLAPFTSRFGIRVGNTEGSDRVLSKFGIKSTVSSSRSRSISSPIFSSLTSVYRMAAGESPSIEPKLPCP